METKRESLRKLIEDSISSTNRMKQVVKNLKFVDISNVVLTAEPFVHKRKSAVEITSSGK